MAWRVKKVEEQRKLFIEGYLNHKNNLAHWCREFGISRPTAYKWLERYQNEGVDGLKDRSKARHTQDESVTDEVRDQIIKMKLQEEVGPKKILALLEKDYPLQKWPSVTTIHRILNENGLVEKRKFRRRFPAKTDPLSHCTQPNDIWCIDFKGWIKTKDNQKCDPLTLTDAHSRYLLHCSKLFTNDGERVWDVLEKAFYEYGLPIFLRHDNGPPFATNGAGRLSQLSIKLIKAGVIPEWIKPGKPYQNGRHERMHLTMQKCMVPGKFTLEEQKMKLSEFVEMYNYRRPHEALGQKTPGEMYVHSTRSWVGKFTSPEYPEEYEVKRVRSSGQVSWNGRDIFIGKVLVNEYVGFGENQWGNLCVYYGPVLLGEIDEIGNLILPQATKNTKHRVRIY